MGFIGFELRVDTTRVSSEGCYKASFSRWFSVSGTGLASCNRSFEFNRGVGSRVEGSMDNEVSGLGFRACKGLGIIRV